MELPRGDVSLRSTLDVLSTIARLRDSYWMRASADSLLAAIPWEVSLRTLRVPLRVSVPEDDRRTLAYHVLRAKAAAGDERCTQKSVAVAAGVTQNYVSMILNGASKPSSQVVEAILDALDGVYTVRQLELDGQTKQTDGADIVEAMRDVERADLERLRALRFLTTVYEASGQTDADIETFVTEHLA